MQKGAGNITHEETVHHTGSNDIKEALEILTAQHKSMIKHIATQDEKIIELQKTLIMMVSNGSRIGGQ
ncbi:hypothetical protein HAX54_033693, partial [Datura stramonium]|nr:hypothetical protein [Datura stramonium]